MYKWHPNTIFWKLWKIEYYQVLIGKSLLSIYIGDLDGVFNDIIRWWMKISILFKLKIDL